MAVYKNTNEGMVLLKRSKTIPEVVAEIQEGKRLAGLEVSPCMKDNLKEVSGTTGTVNDSLKLDTEEN